MRVNVSRELRRITWFVFLWAFHGSFCISQTPQVESAEECADWFLASWNTLDRKYACAGEVQVSESDSEGHLTIEWFEIKFVEPSSQKTYHFVESRHIYANGENSEMWEKWLKRDKEYFWCMGDYSSELAAVDEKAVDENGNPAIGVVRALHTPTVFAYSVVSGSIVDTKYDRKELVEKVFAESSVLSSERNEKENLVGFFARPYSGTEIVFDSKSGWMPVWSRGYFRKNRGSELTRSSFEGVNYETKSKWEKIGKDQYFPTAITNFVRHINPKSKTSKTVDLLAAWAVDGIGTEVFSKESLEEYNKKDGPIIALRESLLTKLETIQLPVK